jgi:hypothetical protein
MQRAIGRGGLSSNLEKEISPYAGPRCGQAHVDDGSLRKGNKDHGSRWSGFPSRRDVNREVPLLGSEESTEILGYRSIHRSLPKEVDAGDRETLVESTRRRSIR